MICSYNLILPHLTVYRYVLNPRLWNFGAKKYGLLDQRLCNTWRTLLPRQMPIPDTTHRTNVRWLKRSQSRHIFPSHRVCTWLFDMAVTGKCEATNGCKSCETLVRQVTHTSGRVDGFFPGQSRVSLSSAMPAHRMSARKLTGVKDSTDHLVT